MAPATAAIGPTLASLDVLESASSPRSRDHLERELRAALSSLWSLPVVGDVRQVGMMAGIELAPVDGRALGIEVCERVRHHGVILRPLGDVVVWMPPLSLSSPELATLEAATAAALGEVLG